MSIFQSEAEIQEWLEIEIQGNEGLWECIENTNYLDKFVPKRPVEKRLLESYQICAKSLAMLELISADENISLTKGEILKPDLLLY